MTTSPSNPPKRRWYQYSLRGLFVAITVFAVFLTVWVVYVQPHRMRNAAIKRLAASPNVKMVHFAFYSDSQLSGAERWLYGGTKTRPLVMFELLKPLTAEEWSDVVSIEYAQVGFIFDYAPARSDLLYLAKLPWIIDLTLSSRPSPPADCELLRRVRAQVLRFGASCLSKSEWEAIAAMPVLETLNYFPGPTNEELPDEVDSKYPFKCSSLKTLRVGGSVGERDVEMFAGSPVKSLFVNSYVRGHGIAGFHELERLECYGCPISDQGLKVIASNSQIRCLSISTGVKTLFRADVNISGITELRGLERLEDLTLDELGLKDDDLRPLSACRNLKWLNLKSNPTTGEFFADFQKSQLAGLDLRGTLVCEAGLRAIARIAKLQQLSVDEKTIPLAKRIFEELERSDILVTDADLPDRPE